MPRHAAAAMVTFVTLGLACHADAQERKAYKVVDKNGNITYTQSPPLETAATKDVKKINIAPAQQGRGGYVGNGYEASPFYYGSTQYNYSNAQAIAQQKAAQDQRQAALRAECERGRNTDCNDPAALQYIDSTKIPRRRY